MKVPFSPPDIGKDEIKLVTEVLESGWITTGPKTKLLEQRIGDYCHTGKAVCLSSQTACAEMTLRILKVGPGDEVILPAYTYTATASIVYHVGATPIMIDCKPGSYEMDYDKMEEAINERTKVIIPVDLAGVVCDYDRIYEAVRRKRDIFRPNGKIQELLGRVVIMADAAHAFGARWHGQMCGEIADFTNFSFHAVKNLTTAEGGATVHRLRTKSTRKKSINNTCSGRSMVRLRMPLPRIRSHRGNTTLWIPSTSVTCPTFSRQSVWRSSTVMRACSSAVMR